MKLTDKEYKIRQAEIHRQLVIMKMKARKERTVLYRLMLGKAYAGDCRK